MSVLVAGSPKLIPEEKRERGRSHVASPKHRIPCEPVRDLLRRHGIDTVGKANRWGAENAAWGQDGRALISSKIVEGIVRGKTKSLLFEAIDLILIALDAPEEWWFPTLADDYWQEGVEPEPEYETFRPQAEADAMARDLWMGGGPWEVD